MSSENESHDDSTNKDRKEEPKAIEAAEELKKEQRESERLNVDPEQVLKEERRQPHSVEDE